MGELSLMLVTLPPMLDQPMWLPMPQLPTQSTLPQLWLMLSTPQSTTLSTQLLMLHAAPVVAHAAHLVAHAVHAAPAETYPDEVSPYTFTYAVADDYSKSNFNAEEQSDGASNVAGSYSVALPDGRIQHVKYSSN